jgi:hypothetical protein
MALAVVGSVHAEGNAVTNITTPNMTTTAGNMLHAALIYFGGAIFSSFTDSGSLTWTEVLAETPGSGDTRIRARYNTNIPGTVNQNFTLTLTAAQYPSLGVTEISGQDTAGAFVPGFNQSAAQSQTGGTPHVSPSISTIKPKAILMGLATSEASAAGAFTAAGGWTEVVNQQTTASVQGILSAHKIISSAGSNFFEWTTASNPSSPFVTGIVAYFEAGQPATVRRASLPVEVLSGVATRRSLPLETLSGMIRRASFPIETLLPDLSLPLTWDERVPLDISLPLTWIEEVDELLADLPLQWNEEATLPSLPLAWREVPDLLKLERVKVQRPVATVTRTP